MTGVVTGEGPKQMRSSQKNCQPIRITETNVVVSRR
jgi:hypothetical protein